MRVAKAVVAAAATVAVGLGGGAATASAAVELSPNPFNFTGVNTNVNVGSMSGLSFACDETTFTGNTANVVTSPVNRIPFRAAYEDCVFTIGGIPLPVEIVVHSDWDLVYASGSAASGVTFDLEITAASSGPSVSLDMPLWGCSVDLYAQDGIASIDAWNATPTGVGLDLNMTGIEYDSDCPGISGGSDMAYSGSMNIPGVTLSDV